MSDTNLEPAIKFFEQMAEDFKKTSSIEEMTEVLQSVNSIFEEKE
jgi:hypothetical protein